MAMGCLMPTRANTAPIHLIPRVTDHVEPPTAKIPLRPLRHPLLRPGRPLAGCRLRVTLLTAWASRVPVSEIRCLLSPLRLLPAGATLAGWDSRPLEIAHCLVEANIVVSTD